MSEYFGIYRGSVYDAADPEKRGRLRVLVPQILGTEPSGWAEPTQPPARSYAPAPGIRIWIFFEGGDVNRPVYISADEVTTDKFSANAITTELLSAVDIDASRIVGTYLNADVLLAGSFTAGLIDTVAGSPTYGQVPGQRVEIDQGGFHVRGALDVNGQNPILIDFPTDGSKPSFFAGTVQASTVSTSVGATLGGASTVSTGSNLQLVKGVGVPKAAPTVASTYDYVTSSDGGELWSFGTPLGGPFYHYIPADTVAIDRTSSGTKWRIAQYVASDNKTLIWDFNPDGTVDVPWGSVSYYVAGMVCSLTGGDVWVLTDTGTGNTFKIKNLNWGTTFDTGISTGSVISPVTLGSDGTNLLLGAATNVASSKLKVWTFAISGHTVVQVGSSVTTDVTLGVSTPTGVAKGNFDYGSSRWVTARADGSNFLTGDGTTGLSTSADDNFPIPFGSGMTAFCYWNGNFYALRNGGRIVKLTTNMWTSAASSTWWIGSTYRDTLVGGTGTHESALGAVASFAMVKRARLDVTTPTIPNDPSNLDSPNATSLYIGRGGSQPARTAMWRHPVGSDLAAGQTSATIYTFNFASGVNPPDPASNPNAFPDAVSAIFNTQSGGFSVNANSDGSVGTGTFRESIIGAWTAYTPVVTGAATNPTLGTGGTITGYYMVLGKMCWFKIRMVFGTAAINAGAGAYSWTVPFTAQYVGDESIGTAIILDSSAGTRFGRVTSLNTSTTVRLYDAGSGGGSASASAPVVPGTSDAYTISGVYELP